MTRCVGARATPSLHGLPSNGGDTDGPPFDDPLGFEPPAAATPLEAIDEGGSCDAEADAAAEPTALMEIDAELGLGDEVDVHAPLVQRIVYQDEAAMAELYRAISGRVWRLALRLTQHAPTAEEVVEDVFWQVWRQAPRFDPARGAVLAWVLLITRSRSLDALRAARRNPLHAAESWADDDAAQPESAESADDALSICDGVQRAAQVQAALGALDPLRRQLVSLAFLRGCTQAEIAEQTGLPLGTVKSHLKRALAAMKAMLEAATAQAPPR